jgi:hypothetical protein
VQLLVKRNFDVIKMRGTTIKIRIPNSCLWSPKNFIRLFMFCEIWSCHSDTAADSCLLGCDAVVSDILKDHIKWTIMSSSSETVPEHEGTIIVYSIWTCTSSDTLSHSEDWNLNLNYLPINSGFLTSVSILHILNSLRMCYTNFLAPEKLLFTIHLHLTFKNLHSHMQIHIKNSPLKFIWCI